MVVVSLYATVGSILAALIVLERSQAPVAARHSFSSITEICAIICALQFDATFSRNIAVRPLAQINTARGYLGNWDVRRGMIGGVYWKSCCVRHKTCTGNCRLLVEMIRRWPLIQIYASRFSTEVRNKKTILGRRPYMFIHLCLTDICTHNNNCYVGHLYSLG